MNGAALLAALVRALPLCAVLPMPGLGARAALALVLAGAAVGAPGATPASLSHLELVRELVRGVALGLGVAVPLYAARWAGALVGGAGARSARRAPERLAEVLGWVIFCAAGGGGLLVGAFLGSYARWPVAAAAGVEPTSLFRAGSDLIALGARLALPALLVLALVELAAGVLARFERGAVVEPGAQAMAATARPILAVILLAASVAAFTHGVGAAVLSAREGVVLP